MAFALLLILLSPRSHELHKALARNPSQPQPLLKPVLPAARSLNIVRQTALAPGATCNTYVNKISLHHLIRFVKRYFAREFTLRNLPDHAEIDSHPVSSRRAPRSTCRLDSGLSRPESVYEK